MRLKDAAAILNAGPCPRGLTEDESKYVEGCLAGHPDREKKMGCGIRRIFIGKAVYGGRCFHVERTDGSVCDFSIRKCFMPSASTPRSKFRQAARRAAAVSSVSGKHVHHAGHWTFENIALEFLSMCGCAEGGFAYDTDGYGAKFADPSVARKFREFHDFLAETEELSPEEHKRRHGVCAT